MLSPSNIISNSNSKKKKEICKGRGNFLRKLRSGKSKSSSSFRDKTTSSVSNEPPPSDHVISVSDKINAAKKNKTSFDGKCLHELGETPNPYEKAIYVIGQTLAPFDEDNFIPCFGFGNSTTHDEEVFSFHSDKSPCHGFEEVLACYRRIAPNLRLSGPTSYGPLIDAAVDIVEKNGGQFHVLVIVADGQVTRGLDMAEGELSQQEKTTIDAIVHARPSLLRSSFYLAACMLYRLFWSVLEMGNFQFVNFTEIMKRVSPESVKETAFALAALMEIPFQYQAAIELHLLGKSTGSTKKINPRPPPIPYTPPIGTELPSPASNEQTQNCPICLTNRKDVAFGCGHMTCGDCGSRISNCPICRVLITSRLRLYT